MKDVPYEMLTFGRKYVAIVAPRKPKNEGRPLRNAHFWGATCLAKGTESGPRIVRKVAILEFVTSIAISKKVS